jgi:hypothetical protein
MKLKSIISKLKKGEEGTLEKIKIERYIPFATKRAIVKNVALQTTYKDENVYSDEGELLQTGTEQLIWDSMLQDLLTFAYKIAYLTDITIDGLIDEDNIVDITVAEKAYDEMCGYQLDEIYNLYEYINSQFTNDDIDFIIDSEVGQLLDRNNSTANILKILIEDLVSKLPSQEDIGNLMTQIPNQLEGLKDLKILKNNSKKDSDNQGEVIPKDGK